jgi:hypothetical protein
MLRFVHASFSDRINSFEPGMMPVQAAAISKQVRPISFKLNPISRLGLNVGRLSDSCASGNAQHPSTSGFVFDRMSACRWVRIL